MLYRSDRVDAAFLQHWREVQGISGKLAGSLGAFPVCSSKEKNLSILVGILHEGNDGKGFSGSPTQCRGNVGWQFMRTRVNIEDHFLLCRFIEDEPEV